MEIKFYYIRETKGAGLKESRREARSLSSEITPLSLIKGEGYLIQI